MLLSTSDPIAEAPHYRVPTLARDRYMRLQAGYKVGEEPA
jgi:hypothetical protein